MNPLLTDEAVARLPLAQARAELLESILLDTGAGQEVDLERPDRRRRRTVALAAAAVVAVVAAVPAWVGLRADEVPSAPTPPSPTASADATVRERVVLGAPGWRMTFHLDVDGWREVTYGNGGARLSVVLRPARSRAATLAEQRGRASTDLALLGASAPAWSPSPGEHVAVGAVADGAYPVVRGSGMDAGGFAALVEALTWTDEAGFRRTVPADYVGDAERDGVIAGMLADVDLPPGVRRVVATDTDPRALASTLARTVTCLWLEELGAAADAGRTAAVQQARAALAGSRDWAMLQQGGPGRDVAADVWAQAAPAAATGRVPEGYAGALRCDGPDRGQ